MTCSKFRDALDNLPTLTHLVIYGHITRDHEFSIRPSILPMLSSLQLSSGNRSSPHIDLLAIMLAPMLECLMLYDVRAYDFKTAIFQHPEWPASPRYPRLHSFTIKPRQISDAEIDKLMWSTLYRLFPTITEFTLLETSAVHFFKPVLGLNTDSGSSPSVSLWPCLRVLTLGRLRMRDLPLLCDFLSERIAQGYPLSKLRFADIRCYADGNINGELFGELCKNMGVELEEFETDDDVGSWDQDQDVSY